MKDDCITKQNDKENTPQWFVMRFLYGFREKTADNLDKAGIKTFTPKKWVVSTKNGRRLKKYVPVIPDLFFVYTVKSKLDPFVEADAYFQYRYKTGGKYKEPLIVPEDQMNRFLAAVASEANPLYFTPDELTAGNGTRVRLIGGQLDGYEGILKKVKGARAKRLIVEIPGTIAVAIEVTPDLVEILS